MADVRLYCGDCLEILPTLAAGSVKVVITDPPYGTGKYATDMVIPPDVFRALVGQCTTVAIFGYPEWLVGQCIAIGKQPDEWVTWWPTNKFGGKTKRLPKESEAVAIYGQTPGANRLFRERMNSVACLAEIAKHRGLSTAKARMGDVWRDPSPGMCFNHHLRQHPNEKPLSLMIRLVELCTNPGDWVTDPFMGSGTTGVACVQTGRSFIGIEISEEYFKIAERRIMEAQAQLRLEGLV